MAIPESCNLGKRVFKKLSQENAKLGGTDKKAFGEDFAFEARLIHMQPGSVGISPRAITEL